VSTNLRSLLAAGDFIVAPGVQAIQLEDQEMPKKCGQRNEPVLPAPEQLRDADRRDYGFIPFIRINSRARSTPPWPRSLAGFA
jgi:hypothetical protein